MPRIDPVTEPDPAQSEVLAKTLLSPAGEPLNVFATLARSPQLARRVNALGGYFMAHGDLTVRARELVILRTASRIGSTYEIAQHRWIGAKAGLTEEEIEAAVDPAAAQPFSGEDALLLAFADEMVAADTIADATWERLGEYFDDGQRLELLVLVGFYRMLGGVLNGLQVEVDAFVKDAR